jgi:hypothetical protein
MIHAKSMIKNINEKRYIREYSLLIKAGLKDLTKLSRNAETVGISMIIKNEIVLIVSHGSWSGVLGKWPTTPGISVWTK